MTRGWRRPAIDGWCWPTEKLSPTSGPNPSLARQDLFVYFLGSAIVSLTYEMENGESAQIAMVGNEGMLGVSLFMGGESTSSRAVVTSAGHCFVLPADALKEEFARSGPVMHLLLRYTQALITQMAQTAACNRHHTLNRQLCRWLLMVLDRLQGDKLAMTVVANEHLSHAANTRLSHLFRVRD